MAASHHDPAAELAEVFGLGEPAALIGPIARGEQGEIFRVDTPGRRSAVKRLFHHSAESAVAESAAFAQAAAALGVPSPRIIRTASDTVLAHVFTGTYRCYSWVDLDEPCPTLDPAAVGRLVAALHQVDFLGTQRSDPWYTEQVEPGQWRRLGRELTAAGAPFRDQFHRLVTDLIEIQSLLEPAESLRTCHRDLFADNLRASTTGELCLIDWDNAGLADPTHELAWVLFEFGAGDPARMRMLHAAYCDADGPGKLTRPGHFTMIIASLSHIVERALQSWLDNPPESARREHGAAIWFEYAARPLTLRSITEILNSIS